MLDPSTVNRVEAPTGESFQVLGVAVSKTQIPDAIATVQRWIDERREPREAHYVAVTGMHGVMEAQKDPEFRAILNEADLVVPDGMPLVWLGRLKGFPLRRRVYGPELMLTFLQQTGRRYRHYFYGGAPDVPERLAERLSRQIQGLNVVGTYSPPFRPLTEAEEQDIAERINRASPDVVWVGLSTPKQERWMHRFRDLVNAPVLIGVGAAFDIHAGRTAQAPRWMQEYGLEWLYRLLNEPRRLWRRYLVLGPQFVFLVALEIAGLRRVD